MKLSRRRFLTLASLSAGAVSFPGLLRSTRLQAALASQNPFLELDAVAQAELVGKGEVTAVELLEAAIGRIDAVNPSVNAVVTKLYDSARERAASGDFDGPFAGVPFLVKDLNDVAGARTTNGCRAMLENIAETNHAYIQACIDAGLNPCGKTNTPEFGLQATTESLALGPCYNPWDPTRSSGGSSGGAGAAVATGMVPLAHGNDGGGSIRIPSSCCGVFGLKTSRGRLIGTTNRFSLAVQGGLTRTVRDSAHLLAHTERDKPAPGLEPVGLVKGPSERRLRIGMYLHGTRGEQPAADVAEAIQSTAELCRELGHEVVDASLEYDGQRMVDEFLTLWSSTAGEVADKLEDEFGRPVNPQDLEPLTLTFAEQYRNGGNRKMLPAVQFLLRLAKSVNKQVEAYDALLCPVLRTVPPMIGEQGPTVPYDALIERMISYVAYTPLHNITGMPAMSVPLFWNGDGLPIGSQFAARVGGERTLLELAYELEAARPWKDKWAPKSVSAAGEA